MTNDMFNVLRNLRQTETHPKLRTDKKSKNMRRLKGAVDTGWEINGVPVTHEQYMQNKYGFTPGAYKSTLKKEDKEKFGGL